MKNRLKKIRKDSPHGSTQDTFAEYLGISKSNINSYEMGRRNPSDAAISLICQKCGVNESWLRTGEGDPYMGVSESELIANFVGQVLSDSPDGEFKRRFISALSKMDPQFWSSMEEFGSKLLKSQEEE